MEGCLALSFVAGVGLFQRGKAIRDFTLHIEGGASWRSRHTEWLWHSWLKGHASCFRGQGHGSVDGDDLPHTYYMKGDGVRLSKAPDHRADIAFSFTER